MTKLGLSARHWRSLLLIVVMASCTSASPQTLPGLLTTQREAEARAAIAEAERAELLARLPPASAKPLAGTIDTKQFGAAGLVKAFDLAQQLSTEVCAALPAAPQTAVYDAATTQGILAARQVADAIAHLGDDLVTRNKALQAIIDAHTPQGQRLSAVAFTALTAIPATLRAVADVSSLFKTNVGVEGIGYGEGARALFVTALAQHCPDKVAGLGGGYLGELDGKGNDALLGKVRGLAAQRGEFANRIALVQKLADGAKADEKKDLAAVAASGGALLKTVDAFIESLRAGEASDKSPLFNAARYLGYAERTRGMLVLDFDLRLEGMTIVKDSLFTGQRLRLAGVGFLWYRVHRADGSLVKAEAVRRMTRPVEVDLRGDGVGEAFWDGERQ